MISSGVMAIRILCAFLVLEIIAESSAGDIVGKLTVGYQGWFAAEGDNSPRNYWFRWTNGHEVPAPGHRLNFEIWPDVREYTKTYQTGFANLRNGQPAKLFSSFDQQTVETHFKWMEQNGIDVAAVQRFGVDFEDSKARDHINGVAYHVMQSAEKFNRKFYIMWDTSGWKNFHTALKDDWTNTVSHFTNSSAYAKQNGKPVVCIWGFGFTDRPGSQAEALDVIKFLKDHGAYVIGGVPTEWHSSNADSKPGFLDVYTAFNMLSPWFVGRFSGIQGALSYQKHLSDDLAFCKSHNIDYQPVLFAGFAWTHQNKGSPRNQIPRLHGDFMWQQFVNLRKLGITSAYVAMFDEYDEGTAIAKAAETADMIPTDEYFLTLDADGVRVSSDFYLRLVHDGARMIKGEIPLQETHPTKHVL